MEDGGSVLVHSVPYPLKLVAVELHVHLLGPPIDLLEVRLEVLTVFSTGHNPPYPSNISKG